MQPTTTSMPSRNKRIRTAYPRWIEFFRIFDVIYGPALAAAVTAVVGLAWTHDPVILLAMFGVLAPTFFIVCWLSLINCNPYRRGSTRLGQLVAIPNVLPVVPITRSTDLDALGYPLIFKPTLASTNSSCVELVRSPDEARRYMATTSEEVVCGQRFHAGEEFTIMWERWPWKKTGRVTDIYHRVKLHPPGEFHPLSGANTPKHTVAANHLRTPALQRAMEATLQAMENVYCTRFDVRADDAEALARGDLWIMESNGTVGCSGGGQAYSFLVHWPRRVITGFINVLTHPDARVHPRVLRERVRRFAEVGGWDFRICDGF